METHQQHDALATNAAGFDQSENYHTHGPDHGSQRSYAPSVDQGVMEEYSEKPPPPPPRRFYRNKKYWIVCSILTVIIVVVVVLLIVFVFFPIIAQSLMNKANIGVNSAQITFTPPDNLDTNNALSLTKRQQQYDMNQTFFMSMESALSNTGPFSAHIKFYNPIHVYYNDTVLGSLTLPETDIAGGHGTLKAVTPFEITNASYFAEFAKEMLAAKTFVWTMKGKLDITALSRTATIDLNKDIVLNGMGGFPEVAINSFKLPADAPDGNGVQVQLGTALTSPSPIGVQLGTITLAVAYDGVSLGQVSTQNVSLKEGPNDLMLDGVLVRQTDPAALTKIGTLFSNYVSGKISQTQATGVSCMPDGKNAVTWLSEGFKSVQLNVGLTNGSPLDIIKNVKMGYLDLGFTSQDPYSPSASAPNVIADYTIPFGISLNIVQVTQNLVLGTNKTGNFSTINVPWVPATTDQTAKTLQFAMNNVHIQGMQGKEAAFDSYTYDLTASGPYSFQVGGNVTAQAVTAIGNITMGGIAFNLPTNINGLKFLNSTPTTVNGVDMTGGTSENLLLSINVTMDNPSDFSMSVGDVNFAFIANNEQLGNVVLSNLTLERGVNHKTASATFNPKVSQNGQNILSQFVMGKNNGVSIGGFNGSTAVASLATALGAIKIDTTLPGLTSPLIQGGKLTVMDTSPKDGVVGVQVSIANPFSASMAITKVVTSATYKGLPVGNINQDISGNPFNVPGKATAQSQELQMTMNIQPAAVALLLRELAVAKGLDTNALDGLLTMGGFHIQGQANVQPEASVFQGFNVSSYVMQAMQALAVDLQLTSGLKVGDYTDDLSFSQNNVTIATDDTVTKLIPIVGQPIVQQIVDGAKLGFDTIILSAPTDSSFNVQMKGSITNAGPMDAEISFPAPLTIAWQGRVLGTVKMATIQSKADVGAQFDVPGTFSVSDQGAMGDFAGYMINNDNFTWNIYTQDVAVNALGFTFVNVSMNKFVDLAGCGGFKNAVTIESFDLPSNDPAGGITLLANTTIKNPSQVGFNLNGVGFSAYYDSDIEIGVLASDGQANFAPQATSSLGMKGRLIKQTSQQGLDAVTAVFENYLAGKDNKLDIKGESGSGPSGQVGWLTAGFKTLTIKDVIMPGPKQIPELIPSITMKDMEIDFTKNQWAPPTSSKNVQAQVKNPFGFPLGVSQLNMDAKASFQNKDMAELKVPDTKATTDTATGVVTTTLDQVPFAVLDSGHDIFSSFLKSVTSQGNATFGLAGSTNTIADTAVGALKLNNITFDVDSSLAGFNNFGGKTEILSLAITGGTSEYVLVQLEISLNNPSQITITMGDINFDVMMNEFSTQVGTVYLSKVTLKPGNNTLSAQMHMQSTSEKAISQLFSDYMTQSTVPLTIQGTTKSTDIVPLQDAMSSVKLDTTMNGIPRTLVTKASIFATAAAVITKQAKTSVQLFNPLKTVFKLTSVKATVFTGSGADRYQVGHIDYDLPSPLEVPAGGQVTSEEWPVTVDADLLQLLGLLTNPNIKIDLYQNVTVTVGDGFKASMYYYQTDVPADLNFDLLGIPLREQNQTVASNSSSASSSDLPASVIAKLPESALSALGLSGKTETSSTASATSEAASESSSASSSSSSDSSDSSSKDAKTTPAPTSSDKSGDSGSKSDSSSASETSSSKDHILWPFKV